MPSRRFLLPLSFLQLLADLGFFAANVLQMALEEG